MRSLKESKLTAYLFLVGILGVVFAYLFIFGLTPVQYEIDEHQLASSEFNIVKPELEQKILFKTDQQAWLEKFDQDVEEKIQAGLQSTLNVIRIDYTGRIEIKSKELKSELASYVENKEQEFQEKLLARKEFLQNQLTDELRQQQTTRRHELEKYQQSALLENYNQLLNLRLKLNILELSKQEKEDYQQKITDLQQGQQQLLNNKEDQIQDELVNNYNNLLAEYNNKFKNFQQDLSMEIQNSLANRQAELEVELNHYIFQTKNEMQAKLEQKREEIISLSESALLNRIAGEERENG